MNYVLPLLLLFFVCFYGFEKPKLLSCGICIPVKKHGHILGKKAFYWLGKFLDEMQQNDECRTDCGNGLRNQFD